MKTKNKLLFFAFVFFLISQNVYAENAELINVKIDEDYTANIQYTLPFDTNAYGSLDLYTPFR